MSPASPSEYTGIDLVGQISLMPTGVGSLDLNGLGRTYRLADYDSYSNEALFCYC